MTPSSGLLRAIRDAPWLRWRRFTDHPVCARSAALPAHAPDDARDGRTREPRPGQVDSPPVRLVVAKCQVDYAGRLTAHLPMATRVLMIKADGSVLVHSDGGSYKPLNWMSPPCTLREGTTEDLGQLGRLRVNAQTGLGDALDAGDRPLAVRAVLQRQGEGLAHACVGDLPAGDVPLLLEDLGDVGLELRARQRDGVVVRRVRVAPQLYVELLFGRLL